MRVASGNDRQSKRARLHEQHRLETEVLAVDLERVKSAEIRGAEFSEFLLPAEHVRADAHDVEIVGHVQELAKRWLVAGREALRKGAVESPQLIDFTQHDHVGAFGDVDFTPRNEREAFG